MGEGKRKMILGKMVAYFKNALDNFGRIRKQIVVIEYYHDFQFETVHKALCASGFEPSFVDGYMTWSKDYPKSVFHPKHCKQR